MIKAGSTVFLELKNGAEEKKHFRTKVVDLEANQLLIHFPVDEKSKKPHYFLEGTEFRAWFLGKDQAIYLFDTEVLGKIDRKFPSLILRNPGFDQFIRIQRRQYVRIDTSIDVAVHSIHGEFQPFTTITLDVSGGGMALLLSTNHPLKEKSVVDIWLSLHFQSGEILYITSRAKVVRIIQEEDKVKGSLQFTEIKEGDRQKIIRYCFEKQLVIRKREKELTKSN
ncbi:c-di-GMP-binding flagellar brake protein YcgR [Evansella vedderi]|uniref:C-di-GMP-binding flagellar brake protein YcgR n=1 Tax=Evansella vedderi TaxID=38282 RepID=A0ABU0A580_9BACI|nr:PilZ domain-containing protein [Evansella vedderi]MDQ0257500.1 c-di-GMP-binding flagellar brake protein YcgR [Evansella vedderi]